MHNNYKNIVGRYYYAFALIIIVLAYFNNALLSQLENPVLLYSQANRTFWVLLSLKIPQLIVSSKFISISIDLSLFATGIWAVFKPEKLITNFLFALLLTTYVIVFSIYNGHFNHSFVGVLFVGYLMCLPYNWFNDGVELVRYYTCFILSSAAIWKISRGALGQIDHFSMILKNQHAECFNLNIWCTSYINVIVNNDVFGYVLFVIAIVVQLSFLVGFFTKKYDIVLIIFFILFFIGDFLMMHLPFIEIYPLLLCFIERNRLISIYNRIISTTKIWT